MSGSGCSMAFGLTAHRRPKNKAGELTLAANQSKSCDCSKPEPAATSVTPGSDAVSSAEPVPPPLKNEMCSPHSGREGGVSW